MLAGGRTEPTKAYGVSEFTKLEGKRKHIPRSPGHGCIHLSLVDTIDCLPPTIRNA